MFEGKTKDVILLMGNNPQLLESIKAKNISKEISRLWSRNPSIIKSTKTPISWYLTGSTLEEMCQLMASYQNIIPVRASGGHLSLFDLSAPFLFRGRKRYYGSEINLTH